MYTSASAYVETRTQFGRGKQFVPRCAGIRAYDGCRTVGDGWSLGVAGVVKYLIKLCHSEFTEVGDGTAKHARIIDHTHPPRRRAQPRHILAVV